MPWLLRDGEVLASLEIARTRRRQARGLLGLDGFDGALLLPSTRSVHTFGMRFPVDVAFCSTEPDGDHDAGADAARELTVVRTVRMRRGRVSLPSLRARAAIEAEAGAFDRWNLQPGDQLEVKQ